MTFVSEGRKQTANELRARRNRESAIVSARFSRSRLETHRHGREPRTTRESQRCFRPAKNGRFSRLVQSPSIRPRERTSVGPRFRRLKRVHPEGFEPPTLGSEDRCSIQLSYGCKVFCRKDLLPCCQVRRINDDNRLPNLTREPMADKRPKPDKPSPDFPLTAHANGQWCKKIRGKVYFFGVWDDPAAALQKYVEQRDNLQAGRQPRRLSGDELTGPALQSLSASPRKSGETGELDRHTFQCYDNRAHDVLNLAPRWNGRRLNLLIRSHLCSGQQKRDNCVQQASLKSLP